jgi:hypothetical protein
MQRWLSVLLGCGVLVVAVLLAANGVPARHRASAADAAIGDAEAEAAPLVAIEAAAPEAAAPPSSATAGLQGPLAPGFHMPDGTPVPPLPDKPTRVHFGVVLVTYAGVQGAPDHPRTKREAREIAEKLAVDAKADFHGAVARGDNGSVDDAGSMPRGVLEPAVEYAIFTLPVGSVSDPLETPRGYWIVKRTE